MLFFYLAPGSYDVEKAEKVLQSSSAYSFGVKYKDQKSDNIPGKQFLKNFIKKCIFFYLTIIT